MLMIKVCLKFIYKFGCFFELFFNICSVGVIYRDGFVMKCVFEEIWNVL